MTKSRSTKSALISSVVALLLCFTMLLGTTFAWFTDSVTSANNIIKSGNLDIALDYWDGDSWETVEGTNSLFTNNLWEPGHTEVVYLKLSNLGSLALKYQLAISVLSETEGTNMAGDPFKLSDYIQMGVVEGVNGQDAPYATREAAVDAVKDASGIIGAGYAKQGNMLSGDPELYMAVVVYMPENVGNEANAKTGTDVPTINLGVQVLATQYTAESDGFDNQYDEGAWAPGMQVYTADDLQAAINNGETNITLMDDIELNESIVVPAAPTTYSLRNATPSVVINLNGKTITTAYNESTGKHAYAIDNYGSLVINGGTIEARGIYNREDATLTVNETEIVNLDMNGGSCIWSYGGEVYINNATLIGYTGCVYSEGYLEINGGTYTCYSAVTDDGEQISPTYNIRSTGELVINGGDFTSRHGLLAIKGSAEINGGTYTMTSIGVITSHVFYVYGDSSNVVVNDGTFNCDLRTAQNNGSSMICVNAADVTVNVYGGTFNLTPAKYVADGYKAIDNGDGTFTVDFPQESVNDFIENAAAGDTVKIPAGTFTFPSSSIKEGVIIECEEGTVFEGNTKLNINGATVIGATFSNPTGTAVDQTINGTFKDCTFTGSNGLRWCYAGDTVVFENCVFSGDLYGVHFDGGATKVIFKNCTISGFNAMAGSIELTTFEGCTFKANGRSNYNGINMWGNTEMTDCTFIFDGKAGYEWIDLCGANKYATFTDCVVTDGTNTLDILDYVSKRNNNAKIVVDGETVVFNSDDLALAISNGESNLYLAPGEYNVDFYGISARDSMTINGHGADTKVKFSNLQVRASQFNELTISNCTIERMPNKSWGHLVFGSSVNPGGVYTISNCVFNGVGSQGIYINQTVEATFNIENCTFNGDFGGEGAITVQNNDGVNLTVNVTDCTFNNIPATSHEICVLYAYDGWTLNADGVDVFWKAK